MNPASSAPTFGCPECGRRYTWNERLGGRAVKCACGRQMIAPATPEGPEIDESRDYDLADEPLLEELPSRVTPRAVRAPVPPVRKLNYESKAAPAGVTFKDIVEQLTDRSMLVPAALLLAAIGVRFALPLVVSSTGGKLGVGAGLGLVVLSMLVNSVAMLIGVAIVARFMGSDLGPLPVVTLRLMTVGVFGSALFAVVANIDGTHGALIAIHALFIFNWIMFAALFEFDIQESLFAVAIVGILQSIGAMALLNI